MRDVRNDGKSVSDDLLIILPSPTPPTGRSCRRSRRHARKTGGRPLATSQIWGSRGFPHGIPAPGPNTRGWKKLVAPRLCRSENSSPSTARRKSASVAVACAPGTKSFGGTTDVADSWTATLVPEGWSGFMGPCYARPQSGSRSQGHPARTVKPQDGSAPAAYTRLPAHASSPGGSSTVRLPRK